MISESLSPLANHLWQSTLFAIAAGLLTLALKKNRAAIRYALWLAASLKFLVPFSLLIAIGHQIEWPANSGRLHGPGLCGRGISAREEPPRSTRLHMRRRQSPRAAETRAVGAAPLLAGHSI